MFYPLNPKGGGNPRWAMNLFVIVLMVAKLLVMLIGLIVVIVKNMKK